MTDCIFCKIISGEVPCTKLYEDDEYFSFLDIAPINKGHALVIHKKHHETFVDTPDEILSGIMPVIKKISGAILESTGAQGVNIGLNNGAAAGQVVFHTHFHIIPRFNDDGLVMWPSGEYEEGEMDKVGEKIANLL